MSKVLAISTTAVMLTQANPSPVRLRWKLGDTWIVQWSPKSSALRQRATRQRASLLESWSAISLSGPVSQETEEISQTDRNVTDKNMIPCFGDLRERREVWPGWPAVKAQTGELRKATERGQSCMVVFPHYKLELVLPEHFLLEPRQQSRAGQRWMTKTVNRDQSLPEERNLEGKPKNRATYSLCVMTCRFGFLHITTDMLKEEPLQDPNARSFEWKAIVCSPQSPAMAKY